MIRKYESTDLEQVLNIWYEASVTAHPFLGDDFLEAERARIIDRYLPTAETYVYELNNQILGFLSLVDHEVGGLFVAPHQHRQGIGGRLLAHARALKGTLELDVFKENLIGRAFYERHGFRLVGEQVHEETGHPQLRLKLPDG